MKLKHRSIRFKFFAAISIIALVFIGILVLLNVFFYQDYYMMTRRSELRDAYGSICTSYARHICDQIFTVFRIQHTDQAQILVIIAQTDRHKAVFVFTQIYPVTILDHGCQHRKAAELLLHVPSPAWKPAGH